MSPSAKLIDIVFLVLGFLFLAAIVSSPIAPETLEYIPDAIRGLTTLTGILVAVMIFSLSHIVSRFENREIRNWLGGRITYAIALMVIVILLVAVAYSDLVYGRLIVSYTWMLASLIVILILVMDTFAVLALTEEAFQSVRKEG